MLNKMNKILTIMITFWFLVCLCGCAAPMVQPPDDPARHDAILSAAENFFKAMRQKNYPLTWSTLSSSSRKKIIDDVADASKKAGVIYTKEQLLEDFETGGPNATAYWDSFLTAFDPDMVLEDSKWTMGKIKSREAQIVLLHNKSERPAVLKMFEEDGVWKFGLKESFGARNINPF